MIYLLGTEYIFGMSRPVYMKILSGNKCIQIIPSLHLIQKTSVPTSWAVQRDLGKPRFWEYIEESVYNNKLNEIIDDLR